MTTCRPQPSRPLRHIVLAFDQAALAGGLADTDIVAQLDAAEAVFQADGDRVTRLPVDLDLGRLRERLRELAPDVVFNLVESLDRSDRLQTLVPLVLEDWGYAFTGSGSGAMLLSNHKIASKQFLATAGLPVPDCAWLEVGKGLQFLPAGAAAEVDAGKWIVKALESHASVHLDDASVTTFAEAGELARRLAEETRRHGLRFFAERYIEGREFNLSVIARPGGKVEVLPAAEIEFVDFPDGKPRIVGHAAKWEEESAECRATPRRFPDGPADVPLLALLSQLTLRTWEVLRLTGYARVDFRVDRLGRPYILEANTNPCLSPDAGLPAAAERAGIGYAELCRIILETAQRHGNA